MATAATRGQEEGCWLGKGYLWVQLPGLVLHKEVDVLQQPCRLLGLRGLLRQLRLLWVVPALQRCLPQEERPPGLALSLQAASRFLQRGNHCGAELLL